MTCPPACSQGHGSPYREAAMAKEAPKCQATKAKTLNQGQGSPYRQAAKAKAAPMGTLPWPRHFGLPKYHLLITKPSFGKKPLLREKFRPLNEMLGNQTETQLWALEMTPIGFRCDDKPIQARRNKDYT